MSLFVRRCCRPRSCFDKGYPSRDNRPLEVASSCLFPGSLPAPPSFTFLFPVRYSYFRYSWLLLPVKLLRSWHCYFRSLRLRHVCRLTVSVPCTMLSMRTFPVPVLAFPVSLFPSRMPFRRLLDHYFWHCLLLGTDISGTCSTAVSPHIFGANLRMISGLVVYGATSDTVISGFFLSVTSSDPPSIYTTIIWTYFCKTKLFAL